MNSENHGNTHGGASRKFIQAKNSLRRREVLLSTQREFNLEDTCVKRAAVLWQNNGIITSFSKCWACAGNTHIYIKKIRCALLLSGYFLHPPFTSGCVAHPKKTVQISKRQHTNSQPDEAASQEYKSCRWENRTVTKRRPK